LIQLGDASIYMRADLPTKKPEVTITPPVSAVVILQVWREEFVLENGDQAWKIFIRGPVKNVLSAVMPKPQLPDDVIGLWERRWLGPGQSKRANPEVAEGYSFTIRVQLAKLTSILVNTGVGGIFADPKDANNVRDDTFKVVWLKDLSLDEVRSKARMVPQALGLARSRVAYGIRVLSEHAEMVHTELKPGAAPLKVLADPHRYRLTPLPPGCDRATVEKLIEDLGIVAKPIKTLGRQVWEIETQGLLPEDTFRYGTTLLYAIPLWRDKVNLDVQPVLVEGSKVSMVKAAGAWAKYTGTQNMEAQGGARAQVTRQQWQAAGVFAASAAQAGVASSSGTAATVPVGPAATRLEDMEKRIWEKMEKNTQAATKATDDKMNALEAKVDRHGTQLASTADSVEKLGRSMEDVNKSFKSELHSAMAAQMQNLTALLADKRGHPAASEPPPLRRKGEDGSFMS
jgi:hypothetical protein